MSKGPHTKPVNPQADQLLASIDSLEDRVQQSRGELESASQLETLGLLTGAIAHEFNNILTPVLSYARVALEHPEDRDLCQRALERAAIGVERASRIASSVLRLAGRDGESRSNESCSPAAALQGALACLPQPLDALSIELCINLPDQVRLAIPQTDLEHVLLNLLLNSCRAIGKGGGVIEIAASDSASSASACSTWNEPGPPPPMLALTIRDDGPGIDERTRAGLFQPFQRSGSSDPQGHGLGLAICRQLIEAAGGTITTEPDTSRGAAFVISLPRSTMSATPAA